MRCVVAMQGLRLYGVAGASPIFDVGMVQHNNNIFLNLQFQVHILRPQIWKQNSSYIQPLFIEKLLHIVIMM